MKILVCHNAYQLAGGEDAVVEAEIKLLKANGHEVYFYHVSNEQIDSALKKLQVALSVSYNKNAYRAFKQELQRFRPDIVHCHNIFPLLTASIYDACVELSIPVVQTLHNYRNICANALFLRQGSVCEKCLHGSPYQAVLHKCYRQSKAQSFFVANMIAKHKKSNVWDKKVTRFIALTDFARKKFIEAGFPEKKIVVKPNFVSSTKKDIRVKSPNDEPYALFVGRLSEEKGLRLLLEAWKGINLNLVIVGAGPLGYLLNKNTKSNIFFLGKQPPDAVNQLMHQAKFLVVPSQCYETFGMVVVEAYAQGTPVICPEPSAMAELVEFGVTGLTFKMSNAEDLRAKVLTMINQTAGTKNIQAVQRYERLYSAEANYQQLMQVYQEAINA